MNRPVKKERNLSALMSRMGLKISSSWGTGSLLQNHENGGKLPILLRQAEMNTHSYIQA